MNKFLHLFWETSKRWYRDKMLREGAALSFYTIVALPSFLLLIATLGGFFLNGTEIRLRILGYASLLAGDQAGNLIEQILTHMPKFRTMSLETLYSAIVLTLSAGGAFFQLKFVMNKIWNITPQSRHGLIKRYFFARGLNLLTIIILAAIFLASLLAQSIISFSAPFVDDYLPFSQIIIRITNSVAHFFLLVIVLGILYKILPDTLVGWRSAWMGALMGTILFSIGHYFILWYVGRSTVINFYGALGSIVTLLLWIYYSSQAFFLGAEFTRVYEEKMIK